MEIRTMTAGHEEDKVEVVPRSDSERNQRLTILAGHNDKPPSGTMGKWRRGLAGLAFAGVTGGLIVVAAGPASAQGGCKAFGHEVAALAKSEPGALGDFARASRPLNDDAHFFQELLCAAN